MQKLREEIDDPDLQDLAPRTAVVAVVVVAALAAGIGIALYRRRRRRSLIARLQAALPEVDDLRQSLKRPLERVVKAL